MEGLGGTLMSVSVLKHRVLGSGARKQGNFLWEPADTEIPKMFKRVFRREQRGWPAGGVWFRRVVVFWELQRRQMADEGHVLGAPSRKEKRPVGRLPKKGKVREEKKA